MNMCVCVLHLLIHTHVYIVTPLWLYLKLDKSKTRRQHTATRSKTKEVSRLHDLRLIQSQPFTLPGGALQQVLRGRLRFTTDPSNDPLLLSIAFPPFVATLSSPTQSLGQQVWMN